MKEGHTSSNVPPLRLSHRMAAIFGYGLSLCPPCPRWPHSTRPHLGRPHSLPRDSFPRPPGPTGTQHRRPSEERGTLAQLGSGPDWGEPTRSSHQDKCEARPLGSRPQGHMQEPVLHLQAPGCPNPEHVAQSFKRLSVGQNCLREGKMDASMTGLRGEGRDPEQWPSCSQTSLGTMGGSSGEWEAFKQQDGCMGGWSQAGPGAPRALGTGRRQEGGQSSWPQARPRKRRDARHPGCKNSRRPSMQVCANTNSALLRGRTPRGLPGTPGFPQPAPSPALRVVYGRLSSREGRLGAAAVRSPGILILPASVYSEPLLWAGLNRGPAQGERRGSQEALGTARPLLWRHASRVTPV